MTFEIEFDHLSITWVWDKLKNTVFETSLRRFNQIVNNRFNNFKQLRDTISWLIIWLRRWVTEAKLISYISKHTCVNMCLLYRLNSKQGGTLQTKEIHKNYWQFPLVFHLISLNELFGMQENTFWTGVWLIHVYHS